MALWPSKDSEFNMDALKDITTSRDPSLAHPLLWTRLKEAIEGYERMFPGRHVLITCTYRSPKEQRRLFSIGRNGDTKPIVTNADGIIKKSKHNVFPARAIDIAITDGGKIMYDECYIYPLANLARECKLEPGGFWTGSFQDWPHFQLRKEDI